MKRNSEAKKLVSEAKNRLSGNGYSDYFRDKDSGYVINNKKLSADDFRTMYKIIKEVASSEEFVPDVLNKLVVDRNDFSKLNEEEKVRYMLELSRIYAEIKKKI